MKLNATQDNLHKALSAVGRVIGTRGTLPVLNNVLLQTDKNRLKVAATNLEIGVTRWIGAKVDEEGSITIPARLLSDFVANLPNDNVKLTLDETRLAVASGGYKSQLNGIAADEFPALPVVDGEPIIKIEASVLREAVEQVVNVVSVDDARPVLTGVYMYVEEGDLYLATTDSYRLAEKRITLTDAQRQPGADELKVIVPGKTMQELARMLADTTEEVQILYDEGQILFRFEETELISRLVEGQFPDYRQLIPDSHVSKFTVTRSEFARVAKVSALFARENAGSVSLNVDTDENIASLHSIASQVGENTSRCEVEAEGESIEVALNSRYISDALQMTHGEKVTFTLTGKVNPCIVTPAGSKDPDYQHLIMPLRS